MFKNLITLAVLAAVGIHGWFYFSYGTFDPCTAAAYRAVAEQQSDVARGAGAILSGPLENLLRSKGVVACYRTALTGELPDTLP